MLVFICSSENKRIGKLTELAYRTSLLRNVNQKWFEAQALSFPPIFINEINESIYFLIFDNNFIYDSLKIITIILIIGIQ